MKQHTPRNWALFSVLLTVALLEALGRLWMFGPGSTPPHRDMPRWIALYVPPKRHVVVPRPKPAPPGPKAPRRKARPAAPKRTHTVRQTKRARPARPHAAPGTGAPVLAPLPVRTPARRTPPAPIIAQTHGTLTLPAAPLSTPSQMTDADIPAFSPTPGAGGAASGAGTGGATAGSGAGGGPGTGGGKAGGGAGEPFGLGAGGGNGRPRHVVYVLDISGSMTSRINRARSELLAALDGLGPDETFDIAAFSDDVQPFDRTLSPASPGARAQARNFLYSLRVDGGTNLEAAILFALNVPDVNEVFVITDGDPTEGETDWDTLTRRIRARNTAHARIDTVGLVGKDPEGHDRTFEGIRLLSRISADSGGQFRRVSLGTAD